MAKTETRPLWKRLRFVLAATVLSCGVLLIVAPIALGAGFMSALLLPGCGGDTPPETLSLAYETVQFPNSEFDGTTLGYWLPPANGLPQGIVIVVPTGIAGRGDRLAEIAVYVEAGYAVLSYRSRACVAADASIGGVGSTLGYRESMGVVDALRYVQSRPDAEGLAVRLHGFSAGGAAALLAAAQLPDVAGVVAEGNYHNFDEYLAQNAAALGLLGDLYLLGARWTYEARVGAPVSVLAPDAAVGAIAPRPVLLIYGTNEPALVGARAMAALGEHVTLWEVAGAGHGNYVQVAGKEMYAEWMVGWWEVQ